jgi:hypothetical protein
VRCWYIAGFVAAFAACGDDVHQDAGDAAPRDAASDAPRDSAPDAALDAAPDAARLPRGQYTFHLNSAAFPLDTHPSVLVYVPPGLDPTPPVDVVVYIHGFSNCVDNIVRDVGQPCTSGPARSAYNLEAQLDASGKNALLVCPEVAYDVRDSSAGQLGVQDGFKKLLAETLGKMTPTLGPLTIADVGKVLVFSHSGGDVVAEDIALKGGLPVEELILFDSLYQDVPNFETWVEQDLPGLTGFTPRHRFAAFYTMTGGTLANSQRMADELAPMVAPAVIVDDRDMASTWTDATYHHGLLFKYSSLAHDVVPRYYFVHVLSTSSLRAR